MVAKKYDDLTGETFGRLTVVGFGSRRNRGRFWLCQCSCGGEDSIKEVITGDLTSGKTKSCGCLRREISVKKGKGLAAKYQTKHNLSRTPEYASWSCMISRCTNPKDVSWFRYGGAGIKVCERWLGEEGLKRFVADMGSRPSGTSLDRIDNRGHYEPSNCRWATRRQQCRNRNSNRSITLNGATKSVVEWAEQYGQRPSVVYKRLCSGWEPLRALTQPVIERAKPRRRTKGDTSIPNTPE